VLKNNKILKFFSNQVNKKMTEIILQAKIGKHEFRRVSLGSDMLYVETQGLQLAFQNQPNIITYMVDKNSRVEFEFGSNYYNVIITN
jgi:hypothetical protein